MGGGVGGGACMWNGFEGRPLMGAGVVKDHSRCCYFYCYARLLLAATIFGTQTPSSSHVIVEIVM
jgi:hypothetical protein